jgi:hypothetical protein
MNVLILTGLLDKIIDEVSAEQRRQHDLKIRELSIIESSGLRDAYVQQLLLNKFLAPIEAAQHQIQNSAKHAQWMAEALNYYFWDHGLDQEQAKELSTQLRLLAVRITYAESLYEIKLVYTVATLFADKISVFKHRDMNCSLEKEIRKGILDPLNACIATEKNFQRRLDILKPVKVDVEEL